MIMEVQMDRRSVLRMMALGAASATSPTRLLAQSYPAKSVKIIVPFAAGGFNDILARVVGNELSTQMSTPVVIENRTGAGGAIGSEAVARAEADGYTLLIASFPHVVAAAFRTDLPYDPVKDFEPITFAATTPNVLVVHPGLPVNSVADLVAYAKANPGKLSYASNSPGGSSHLAMELFKLQAGKLDIVHIPYRGSSAAVTNMLTGEVQLTIDNAVFYEPYIRDGRVRALATVATERTPLLRDVPSMREAGFPELDVSAWYVFAAPAKTPKEIVQRLNKEIIESLKKEAVISRIPGAAIVGSTPDAARELLATETEKWKAVVRQANIQIR
jgi:tripartite-type tricarboxylate transporter receptor subunit TctC